MLVDTQRIQEAVAREDSLKDVEVLVQVAANDLRRIFDIESILEIVDDGTAPEELLDLKAAVLELEDVDPRISLFMEGEPDTGQDHL